MLTACQHVSGSPTCAVPTDPISHLSECSHPGRTHKCQHGSARCQTGMQRPTCDGLRKRDYASGDGGSADVGRASGTGEVGMGEVETVQLGCGQTVSVRAARLLVGKLLPFDLQKRGEERRRLLTGIAHTGRVSVPAGRQATCNVRHEPLTGRRHARRTTQAKLPSVRARSVHRQPSSEQRTTNNEQTCTVRHARANKAALYACPAHSAKLNPPETHRVFDVGRVDRRPRDARHPRLEWSQRVCHAVDSRDLKKERP